MSRTLRHAGRLALAAVVTTAVAFAGATPAASLEPSPYDDGLFGVPDIYGSTYRHSLALLALSTSPDPDDATFESVGRGLGWLVDQQCEDGGWMGYRADITQPCEPDAQLFTGEDTNTTAIAVQALATFGEEPAEDPRPYFRAAQAADGGFEYQPGFGSDPNSTALVVQALIALGEDPLAAEWAKNGKSPLDALLAFQLGCAAPEADRGGVKTPFSNGAPNVFGTVQAGPAYAGQELPVVPDPDITADSPTPVCADAIKSHPTPRTATPEPTGTPTAEPTGTPTEEPSAEPSAEPTTAEPTATPTAEPSTEPTGQPAASGETRASLGRAIRPLATVPQLVAASGFAATWLANRLTGGVILNAGEPDWARTADAAQAIAASGTNSGALTAILAALATDVDEATAGADTSRQVGSLANVALAAFAGGADPTDFGGVDLLAQVRALQFLVPTAPSPTPSATPTAEPSPQPSATQSPAVDVEPDGSVLPRTGSPLDDLVPVALLALTLGVLVVLAARVRSPYRGRHTA